MDGLRKLIEKLKRIEALHAGATTDGERAAADSARQRIREKISQYEKPDPPVEYKFTLNNAWSRRLFVALLRRYDIKPYRYHKQRYNTVMARVSKDFVNKTLWPEFLDLDKELARHLDEVVEGIIKEAIYADSSEAEEIGMLPQGEDG